MRKEVGKKKFCKCKQKCVGEKKHGNWNAVKLYFC